MLSIGYYPDVIHIAFIAPVFLVTIAEAVEWGMSVLPARVQPGCARGASWALAVVCVGRLAIHLVVARRQPTQAYASSFGRVDVSPEQVEFLDGLAAQLAGAPSRTLYVNPNAGYLSLLLDARNPTRYEFVLPGFHDAEVWQEIAATLAADPPPLYRHAPSADSARRSGVPLHHAALHVGQRRGSRVCGLVAARPAGATCGAAWRAVGGRLRRPSARARSERRTGSTATCGCRAPRRGAPRAAR